jgi:hypothetical protein
LLSLSFFRGIPSPSHIHHYQFTFCSCHNILKGSEAKVDEGQLFLHGNKEDMDLQLEGLGVRGSSNKTEKKVRAMFLKLYTNMPYMTTTFVVARGVFQAQRRPPQAVTWDQHPSSLGDIASPLLFFSLSE